MHYKTLSLAACLMVVAGVVGPWGLPTLPAAPIDAGDGTAILNATDKDDPSQYLGPQYKDENAGFRMCPPAGSRIINRADLDLMSYVVDAKQWGGNVQMLNLKKEMTVEEYLRTTSAELSRSFSAVQVLDSREVTFQKTKAGRLTTSMVADIGTDRRTGGRRESMSLLRQQLMLQLGARQYMVLTFYTPLKDREAATKTWEAMLTAFELLDRKAIAEQRSKGVEAGRKWLEKLDARELKSKLSDMPQLFRIRVAGRDVGYVRFNATEITRDKLPGLVLNVDSRAFPNDSTVVMGSNEAYWAFPKPDEEADPLWFSEYINNSKTVLLKNDNKREEFWLMETGRLLTEKSTRFSKKEFEELNAQRAEILRGMNASRNRQDGMSISMKHEPGEPPPLNPPRRVLSLSIDRTGDITQQLTATNRAYAARFPDNGILPLPKILEYTWPRLVDVTKPTSMTFLVYNGSSGKPAYRTLSVLGPEKVNIDGQPVSAYKLSDEMDPGTTYIWTDDKGKMLLMRTSDQSVLTPTSEESMRLLWGKRLEKIK